jgi:hypothetical protein
MTFLNYAIGTDYDVPENSPRRLVLQEEHTHGYYVIGLFAVEHEDEADRMLKRLKCNYPNGFTRKGKS